MRLIFLTIYICSIVVPVFGQSGDSLIRITPKKVKSPTIGIGLLGTTYVGDYTDKFMEYNRIYPGVNFSLQPSLSGRSSLQPQMNAGIGAIEEQADSYPFLTQHDPNIRNVFMVRTTFFYGDIRLRMRFFKHAAFSPYLSTGIGILLFSPQDMDGNLLIEAPKTRPQGEEYKTSTAYIPAGVGLNWKVSRLVSLGVEYHYRSVFTDYLDNVGKLGLRKGNDALHQVMLALYVSPAPATYTPTTPPIYIPPTKDSTKVDSFIVAEHKTRPKKNKRPPKYLPYQVAETDTAAAYYLPRPLDSVVLSILDTANESLPKPVRLQDIFLFDTTTIYMDTAIAVKSQEVIYPAIRRIEVETIELQPYSFKETILNISEMIEKTQYSYKVSEPLAQPDSMPMKKEKWSEIGTPPKIGVDKNLSVEEQIARENAAIESRKFIYHEVKKWDNLLDIAQKYGVRQETILKLNLLNRPVLIEGATLRIPDMTSP